MKNKYMYYKRERKEIKCYKVETSKRKKTKERDRQRDGQEGRGN